MKAVQPKTAEPASGASTTFFKKGGDAELNNESPFFTKGNAAVQTKLTMGQPNDIYEQEADSMADKVVQRLAEPDSVQTKPLTETPAFTPFIQSKCASCENEEKIQQKEEKEQDQEPSPDIMTKSAMGEAPPPPPPSDDDDRDNEQLVQRKCAECEKEEALQKKGEGGSVSPALERNITSSKGGGSPLPEGVRTNMESSMGADFSNVRVHTNSNAVSMNQQLRAQAFTHGNDIFFNSGKYNPGNKTGQHLLAHELTHTVQQGQSKTAAVHTRMLRMKSEVVQLQAQLAVHADSVMTKRDTPNVQANLLDDLAGFATSAFGSLEDMLGIELPSSPLEAIRMIVNAAESPEYRSTVDMVPGLRTIILTLRGVLVIADLIQEVIDHKEEIIQAIKDYLNEQIARAPDLILEAIAYMSGIDVNHLYILFHHYFPNAINHLINTDWWDVLKNVLWEQLWPLEGITTITEPNPGDRTGFGRDLAEMFGHVDSALSALSELRISQATDEILQIGRSINILAGRFYGWVALVIIATEAVMGGIAGAAAGGVGAIPGIFAGIGSGVATADVVGYVLLATTVATEVAILVKSGLSLHPVHETLTDEAKANENHNYYTQITQSAISLGIMGALALFAWLAGKAAGAIMSKLYEFLPKNVQELVDQFVRAYTARRAQLMPGGAASSEGTGSGGGGEGGGGSSGRSGSSGGSGEGGGSGSSSSSGGSSSSTGGGSTGERNPMTIINGEGQGSGRVGGGGRGRGGTRASSGGGGGASGGEAFEGGAARKIEISPDPDIDSALNPAVEPTPDPLWPPWRRPIPEPVPAVPEPIPVPDPVPAVPEPVPTVPDPVPGPIAGTRPTTGTVPGTGIGIGLGLGLAHSQRRRNNSGGPLYKWDFNRRKGNNFINYTGRTRPGVDYEQHDHHVWPKVLGGPNTGQQLLTIIESIHMEEMHYGRSPVGSPIVALVGSIYNYLTNAINNHLVFGVNGINVLQGYPLTHPGGAGSSNTLLVRRMRARDRNARLLKSFVRDTLTVYYGLFSAQSTPTIPYAAYRTGLNQSYSLI